MIESGRVSLILSEMRSMSAADMKQVARFGKVKGYSQQYTDLKESLRSMLVMARNIHGIRLDEDFAEIEPISFTGMIPNEMFNSERKRILELGEKLVQELDSLERRSSSGRRSGPASAEDEDQISGAQRPHASGEMPKIYISESNKTPAGEDLRRCLATSDCDVIEVSGPTIADVDYFPDNAAEDMLKCHGAMICLMDPDGMEPAETEESDEDDDEDEPTSAEERTRIAKNALFELGMALGLFPERTFFVVQKSMIDEVPESLRDLISFRTSGGQLSFDEGQRMVQAFKQVNWTKH